MPNVRMDRDLCRLSIVSTWPTKDGYITQEYPDRIIDYIMQIVDKYLADRMAQVEKERDQLAAQLQIIEAAAKGKKPLTDENDPRWSPAYLDVVELWIRKRTNVPKIVLDLQRQLAAQGQKLKEAEAELALAGDCGFDVSKAALDAYVQENVDRAVLAESEWWAKYVNCALTMGDVNDTAERLTANRVKVKT